MARETAGCVELANRDGTLRVEPQALAICRVENNRFSDYARLGASISGARSQRGASRVCCEAARAAIRFGGQTTQDVLKCTIAPGICPKWGVELALISLSFLSPFPPFAAQVRVPGPAHWPTGT